MKLLLPYLFIINALSFLLMHMDKEKAKAGRWRIPEATLLCVAFMGGSLGAYLGMRVFRHKTRHPKFSIGLPVILALQILVYILFTNG